MGREVLTLAQAAAHVHVGQNELRHVAQRGEVEAFRRGDEWMFEHRALDEWAQRSLLAAGARDLRERYRSMSDDDRRERRGAWRVSDLFRAETIDLEVGAKAKGGLIRDMTDLAERGGMVYDPEALFRELVAREEAASTAIGEGVALLHPRFHDPYLFEDSFVAYGRTTRPVFFGARDGEGTRHFFLICSTDHEAHLRILARLAVLAHGSDLVARLDAALDADDVLSSLRSVEEPYACVGEPSQRG